MQKRCEKIQAALLAEEKLSTLREEDEKHVASCVHCQEFWRLHEAALRVGRVTRQERAQQAAHLPSAVQLRAVLAQRLADRSASRRGGMWSWMVAMGAVAAAFAFVWWMPHLPSERSVAKAPVRARPVTPDRKASRASRKTQLDLAPNGPSVLDEIIQGLASWLGTGQEDLQEEDPTEQAAASLLRTTQPQDPAPISQALPESLAPLATLVHDE